MSTAIITANFGGIDLKKEIPQQIGSTQIYYYDELTSFWPMANLDDRMKAKYYKLQTHKILPQYDSYIWIDSSFRINTGLFASFMREELTGYDIAVTKHPERNSINEEAKFVLKLLVEGNQYITSRYKNSQIEKEIDYINDHRYEDNNGLYACGFFIRKNRPMVNEFFDAWWDHTLKFSAFDQLSFPWLAQKHGIKINPLVFNNYLDNEVYTIEKHSKIK